MTDNEILELIDRKPKALDFTDIYSFYKRKTVVVTGGAGSIGSELVTNLLKLDVAKVIVIDNCENNVFYLQQAIDDKRLTCKIANVTSKHLENIYKAVKPDIVIHASAYKHVPLMQENALEAFNNNVYGTYNSAKLASKYAQNFILISSDKAVNTTNVMGATKRMSEIIIENIDSDTIFSAVRFGNVIQSNGSVIPTWIKQIEADKPVTVTHKNIKRYFMSKREASNLILLSAVLAEKNDVFLLDMGEPVKIYDLAKKLIEAKNSRSKIIITGLRPGEKMFEELAFDKNTMERTKVEEVFKIKKQGASATKFRAILQAFKPALNYDWRDGDLFSFCRKLNYDVKRY